MKIIDPVAVYTLWLRDVTRFFRARSRVIGSLGMPFFFLAFLGTGMKSYIALPDAAPGVEYLDFLMPGIIAMILLFGSIVSGLVVIWDRQFGFLKEIMITPVSRVSIVLGRTAGGTTTALIQAIIMLILSVFIGAKITGGVVGVIVAIGFMILISAGFVALGIAFASLIDDMSGFQLVMNFLVFPLFLLSGAMFPPQNLPPWMGALTYADPLTYGVDALRGCLIGPSMMVLPMWVDFTVLLGFTVSMVLLSVFLFNRVEVD